MGRRFFIIGRRETIARGLGGSLQQPWLPLWASSGRGRLARAKAVSLRSRVNSGAREKPCGLYRKEEKEKQLQGA